MHLLFGGFVTLAGILLLLGNLVVSFRRNVPAGDDPWHGPTLEWFDPIPGAPNVPAVRTRSLWLIPITTAEYEYKQAHGFDALEALLEKREFNYLNPERPSVC